MHAILARTSQSPLEGLSRTVWRAFGVAHAEQDRRAAEHTDEPQTQEGRDDMDVITQIRLLWLGGLGTLSGVALCTAWLLGVWQHRREQRRSHLLESVRWQFPVELRDQVALQVHGTMLGRRVVITVDMGHYAPEAWLSIIAGLSRSLLPDVRQLVCSLDAPPFPITVSLTPGRQ
jgi:hypothetical protein